ncbi:MAG: hypothetical protein QOF61_3245 [Acidobacteriota bacterium]|nr:hypothetical protein [Acidobacteriota bacterium]
MKFLTTQADREEAQRRLRELLTSRGEWFCAEVGAGRSRAMDSFRAPVTLRVGDWELRAAGGALHFSCWTERGARVWRVAAWEWSGGKLLLRVTRRAGAERATLELVARASAREDAAEIAAARRAACERLAELVCARVPGAKMESARLSMGARRSEPGRYARILLRRGRRELIAATGALVALRAHEVDAMLASALAWWLRLGEGVRARSTRGSSGAAQLWIIASRELSRATAERLALLRAEVRGAIKLFELNDSNAAAGSDESTTKSLSEVETPRLESLLEGARRFRFAPRAEAGGSAARLVALAPEEIDVVRARHGETVRFNGLAFARVRRVVGRERVWFGVPGAGQKILLDEGNARQLSKLIDELAEHRRADGGDRRHAYFRAAPEAWLESILRRDITRLDPGLIVSPLHVQFRTSREGAGARPVDLLALRRDGRLVVIELKVSEDGALPIQGADYWRRVEAHRRSGDLKRARLFGDLEIADEPPLVYLAAPVFRFHRAFPMLARTVSTEIEMFRFDLNEDWRAGVRVVRRTRVN